ncbi:MAG TPA: hypothetical protein VHN18_02045, partial [Micromonosporaceae bacterium]|nr:hypothetical protein [Micromonosporaceae bacterium]
MTVAAPTGAARLDERPGPAITIASRVHARAQADPRRVAMRHKDLGIWQEVSWEQYWDTVQNVA